MDEIVFGKFLAELRNEIKLTQEKLGEMLNVSSKTISKWECGNSIPNPEILIKLTKIFNVSLYELIECKKIKNPFIFKDDIKKIIDKVSIQKLTTIKIMLLLCIMFIITSIFFCIHYTVSNCNQFQTYNLVSKDKNYWIEGILVNDHNNYYLSLSKFASIKENELNQIKSIEYCIYNSDLIIERKEINFEQIVNYKDANNIISIHSINNKLNFIPENLTLKISYIMNNSDKESINIKIKLIKIK